jgi:hypothetical protein
MRFIDNEPVGGRAPICAPYRAAPNGRAPRRPAPAVHPVARQATP